MEFRTSHVSRAARSEQDRLPTSQPDIGKPTFRSLFREHCGKFLPVYLLFNLENLLRMAQPFVLGWAINDLLRSSYVGLLVFIGQHLTYMLVSSTRRLYESWIFTNWGTELAAELAVEKCPLGGETSLPAPRSILWREYVEFFEKWIPLAIRTGYSFVGALVMLGYYHWMLIPLCFASIVPALLINAAYGRKAFQVGAEWQDQLEREAEVVQQGDTDKIRSHYETAARERAKRVQAETLNFSLMQLFVLGVLIGSLVQYCTSVTPSPGDIFAVFLYVLLLVTAFDDVSQLVNRFTRLRIVGRRMRFREQSLQRLTERYSV